MAGSNPASGIPVGEMYAVVGADLSSYDAAMATLPEKAAAQASKAVQALEKQLAAAQLDLQVTLGRGTPEQVDRLNEKIDRLKEKISLAKDDAMHFARVMQTAASIDVRKWGNEPLYQNAPDRVLLGLQAVGNEGEKAGKKVQQGARGGAMGLMLLSQAVDDAQYGKGCRAAA